MTSMENHIGTRESRPPRAPRKNSDNTAFKHIDTLTQTMQDAERVFRALEAHRKDHIKEILEKPNHDCQYCRDLLDSGR